MGWVLGVLTRPWAGLGWVRLAALKPARPPGPAHGLPRVWSHDYTEAQSHV